MLLVNKQRGHLGARFNHGRTITKTIQDIARSGNHLTILIVHRLSTIKYADRIYVVEKGSIVESSNHQYLLDEKGLYYAMWRQQTGELKEGRIL